RRGLATPALWTADKDKTPRLIYRGKAVHDLEPAEKDAANDATSLLLEGKKLYDAGKTNEAEAKWLTALDLEPGNKVALDYLTKIGRTYSPAPKPAVQPIDAPIPQQSTR